MNCKRSAEICEWWDSSPPDMPARTALFPLEPCARGAGLVESATGYLARLAQVHCVSTGCLLSKVVAPHMAHRGLASRNRLRELFGASGNSFDGNNATVSELVRSVEVLTGQSGLADLTMLSCGGHVSCRGLIRDYQAWCPECLHEWRDSGRTIYVPLLWRLEAARVCPVHGRPLVGSCPRCHTRRGALTRHSRAGFCPVCKHWLGAARGDRAAVQPTEWEIFAAEKGADFVAQAPRILPSLSESHFAANVHALKYGAFRGNKSALAQAVLHSRKTVECWCNEFQSPMLLSLLMLSFRLGVEPISLLSEDVSDQVCVSPGALGTLCLPAVRRTARRHNRKRLRSTLARILDAKEAPRLR